MGMSSINNTTTILSLTLLSQQLNIILGFVILISGLVGNLLNIVVFLSLGSFKTNACSFYILTKSFFDIVALLVGVGTRILSQGFHIDFTLSNRLWCKFRIPLLDVATLCSFSCLCFQSMDTFFVSSRSIFWRRKSNLKVARNLVILFLCMWILLDLPYFFLQDLILNVRSGSYTCVTINGSYALFRSYFIILGLYLAIPVMAISVFGILSYRQFQKLSAHEQLSLSALTKQMIRMILFQIIITLMFVTPNSLAKIYFVTTASMIKSAYLLAQESVSQVVFNIYGYGALSVRKFILYTNTVV
ncbi:unnamed protein product [Rotaria magnacalcarata]|uniref:G-protein coupled receptors family 1 profile domain-containing protein n=1 Tax=Rotaria magnacalcarata TaxID=392030 RepID=A0A816VC42_9BILA|nr:unnamed protein product [Rotaria magnacalcarata]